MLMEEVTHGLLRESVEGALARRLHGIEKDFEIAHSQGISTSALEDQIRKDTEYLHTLVPRYMRRVNRKRSPLLRLPLELLPSILYAASSQTRTRLRGWISLGHISHDLRSALLGMHAIWADVVFDSQYAHVHEELLGRAGQCPILINLSYLSTSKLIGSALALLHRAHAIHTRLLPEEQMHDLVRALGERSFQSLEEVTLSFNGHPINFSFDDGASLTAPKLRSFHLRNMTLPIDLSGIGRLTLHLGGYSPEITPSLSALTFINMLCSCARLESLEIHEWIPDLALLRDEHLDEPFISFPHLTRLILRQDLQRIIQLWTFLSIPRSASVEIVLTEMSCDPEETLQRARALRAFVHHTLIDGHSMISKLSIEVGEDDYQLVFTLGTSRDLCCPNESMSPLWQSRQSFVFKFTIRSEIDTVDQFTSLLGCICLSLQLRLESVETLEYNLCHLDPQIDETGSEEAQENENYLCTIFPAVTTLRIKCTNSDIAYIFRAVTRSGRPRLFPRLQALQLHWTWDPADRQNLIDALRIRIEKGKLLRSIGFDNQHDQYSYASEDKAQYLEQIRTVVAHVYSYDLDEPAESPFLVSFH